MKPRHKRMVFAGIALIGIIAATALVINALQSNIAYFFSPSKVMAGEVTAGETFRLGGMVREGTLEKSANTLESRFIVTDNQHEVTVSYSGILPDLFKEGQGTVAKGKLGDDGVFYAEEVLAKHDESYMPPEVADAMKKGMQAKYAKSAQPVQAVETAAAEATTEEIIPAQPLGPETPLPQVEIK